jgi:hypothetical protein
MRKASTARHGLDLSGGWRDAGEAERDRAETRRAEIAAAIAAFKAKAGIG